MNQIKTLVIKRDIVLIAIQFAVLLGVVTAAPLINQQAITGTIVNVALFISTVLLGAQNAILIGLVPSLIALSVGLLPAVLAPAIPFIMIGNTILILVFDYLRQKNYWLGITVSGFLKFLFLFGTSSIVVSLLLKKEIAAKVAAMMSWPQLFTAMAGGVIAYFILKSIKKTK
jgi:hypothetical protein